MKRGIKLFGEEGKKAILDEMRQIHELKTIEPIENPTTEDKCKALTYLMYLQRKRCGRVKGRGCADGRKQRSTMTKEDTTSPTVSTESIMLTSIIDAEENRDVAVTDIPGAYLHADMEGEVVVRFSGTMVDMLLNIDRDKYEPCIQNDRKGGRVIYARLKKALYGCRNSGLLFFRNITAFLKRSGFTINPYDSCVANRMINGHNCTIVWWVDDLKIRIRTLR